MKQLHLLILFFLIATFQSVGQEAATSSKKVSILFIGNSLTYTNNLPKLVQKKAKKKGIKLHTTTVALPNYALEDHWNDKKTQQLISNKSYDYVIVQQGPSSQQEGRAMLFEYGKKLQELCATQQTQLCFFMVWPSLTYYHTFDKVIKNHQDAAQYTNARLLPVGEVWKNHFDSSKDFSYYGPDGFHPSLKGSQVAANVIVDYLFLK